MATLPDQNSSFGRYLQICRLEKDLSLEMLTQDLRISVEILAAIENEDYSKIPKEVFAKGFLRSFARAVDADGDWVVRDYNDKLIIFNKILQTECELEKENRQFDQKMIISAATMLLVVVLTVFFLSGQKSQSDSTQNKAAPGESLTTPVAVVTDPIKAAPVKVPPVAPSSEAEAVSAAASEEAPFEPPRIVAVPAEFPGQILLKVVTVEKTWLKIIIDSQKSQEYTLLPGDQLELEALSRFNILIGNAAGVKIFANQDLVYMPGERGQVVNVDIPEY